MSSVKGMGLRKTRRSLRNTLSRWLGRKGEISEEYWDDWEEALIRIDLGVKGAEELIQQAKLKAQTDKSMSNAAISETMMDILAQQLSEGQKKIEEEVSGVKAYVVIGVNGSGKTTTVAKLASLWASGGEKVLVAASDTFRAAAGEQLQTWADRLGVEMVSQASGADPAAVAFDAYISARKKGVDKLLVDTAGRLHNRKDLMEEAAKIVRVLGKASGGLAPEVLLVLDATVGQNGLVQAEKFTQALPVSGLILTKLDGTARGGIVVSICRKFNLPILYLGVGEGQDDLVEFEARDFARALLGMEESAE